MGLTLECDCGEITGEACRWSGPAAETVLVEHVAECDRDTVRALGRQNVSARPYWRLVRVHRDCARLLIEGDAADGWTRYVVEGG